MSKILRAWKRPLSVDDYLNLINAYFHRPSVKGLFFYLGATDLCSPTQSIFFICAFLIVQDPILLRLLSGIFSSITLKDLDFVSGMTAMRNLPSASSWGLSFVPPSPDCFVLPYFSAPYVVAVSGNGKLETDSRKRSLSDWFSWV